MPTPSRKLPPSERDFEIYEAVHVRNCSTWSQAEKYEISQTRVRQIIRRVVEWLGEVIPPQTQVAKEQEVHLARQIAADRFQHQLEEATSFWDETRESKYAGIRIRLTTAQARLGVVGGLTAGLAADAIEGIPVPAWTQTEIREGEAPAEPNPKSSATNSQAPSKPRRISNAPLPWYCFDPITLAELTPEIIAGRAAHGCPLPESFVRQYYESQRNSTVPASVVPSRREGPEAEPTFHPNAPSPTIDTHPISSFTPHSSHPLLEDCSTSRESLPGCAATQEASVNPNDAALTSYDSISQSLNDLQASAQFTSQPLLTTENPLPVTELKITPHQPGATITSKSNATTAASVPISLSPCHPVPSAATPPALPLRPSKSTLTPLPALP